MQTFGEQLTKARKAANMTQGELAEKLHVGRTTISNWECDRTQPDLNTVKQLGEVLGCNFFSADDQPEAAEQANADLQTVDAIFPDQNEGKSSGDVQQEENAEKTGSTPALDLKPQPPRRIAKKYVVLFCLIIAAIAVAGIIMIPKWTAGPNPSATVYTDAAGKVYNIDEYKAVPENDPDKAYLSFITETRIQNDSPTGHCMYSFTMKEENGIGFHIDRIDHITFFYGGNVSVSTYTDEDVLFWGDDPDIPPYGTYMMQCGDPTKTPSGEPNATGGALEVFVTDTNGNQLSFSAYAQLPQI